MNENQEYVIPGADEVETVGGGSSSFRFSKGRIVSGREEDGSLVIVPKLVGIVTRIGVYEGTTNDQYKKPYRQLECDYQTRDGEVYIKAGLLDENFQPKATQAALSFAWVLNHELVREKKVIQLTAAQGEAWTNEMGQAREASTYANLFEVKEGKAYPVYRPKADPNAPKVDSWAKMEALLAELTTHPLWAPRPEGREHDADHGGRLTHLSEMIRECGERGWPAPDQCPEDWLAIVAASLKLQDGSYKYKWPVLSLGAIDDDDWGAIRQALEGRPSVDPTNARAALGIGAPSEAWRAFKPADPAATVAVVI